MAPVPERPGEFQLQVLPSTALEDGPFQFQVGLVGVSASGEETAGYSLRVTGTVWPEVRISPSPLALGAMRQGTPRTVAVELQSRSERAFTINGVSGASSVAVCSDLPVGAALFQKLQLGIACDEAGPVSENVQFELQLGDDEPITIDVPVSLYGIGEQVLELKFPEPASS